MSKQELIEKLSDKNVQRYCKRYGIKHLWIFGSYAHGDYTAESDVDLIYERDPTVPYKSWGMINPYLYLQKKLKKQIDWVSNEYIHELIEEDVLSHNIKVW